MNKIFTKILSITLLCCMMVASTVFAAEFSNSDVPTVKVRGRAERVVKADIAYATVGVKVQNSNIKQAQQAVAGIIEQVVAKAVEMGVNKNDIQTSDFSVYFNEHDKNSFKGYTVENNIVIKVTDINRLGAILDSILTVGSNQINNVSFAFSGDEKIREELIREAAANGRKQANIVASAQGMSIGKMLQANLYSNNNYEVAGNVLRMRAMAADKTTQIFAGNIKLSADMELLFELK